MTKVSAKPAVAKTQFNAEFETKVTGTVKISVDTPLGSKLEDLKDEAADRAVEELDDHFSGKRLVSVDNIETDIKIVRRAVCKTCLDRGFKIDVLCAGSGTIKVGPCPECQIIPTTGDVCNMVMELVRKSATPVEGRT